MVTRSTTFVLTTSLQSNFSEERFNYSCSPRAGAETFPRISQRQPVGLHSMFPKNGRELYDHGYKHYRREYLIKAIPTGTILII